MVVRNWKGVREGLCMTRKHFRKLAEALKNAKASDELIEAIACVCKSENPRFNFQTFREACKGVK